MTLFLCGGGSGEQTVIANRKLNEMTNPDLPILYVPFAMSADTFQSCFSWLQEEMREVRKAGIDMVRNGNELYQKNFRHYAAIYIGGGNTFKLLKELKDTGCFEKLKDYLAHDGIVFGGSAGAAIFGHDIDVVKYDDQNEVGLLDTSGFDLADHFSIAAHYTNGDAAATQRITKFLKLYSLKQKVIALPEEDTLLIDKNRIEVLGTRPIYIFVEGIRKEIPLPFVRENLMQE